MQTGNLTASLGILAVIIYGTSLHEMAHAYVAHWRGDPTPGRHGRLTFNPIPHLNPLMTAVILPVFLFLSSGGLLTLAQTPVDPSRMRNPMRSQVLVSLAGPLTNFLWGGFLASLLWIPGLAPKDSVNYLVFFYGGMWNFIIGFFNLIPFPPLDGYGIIRPILPVETRRSLDAIRRSGGFALIGALALGTMVMVQCLPALMKFYLIFVP
jgi:Zn-dependent protease